jgi:hypothetical protein
VNAGLSNLATLKSWLLPSGMVEGTDYDAQILAIGLGIAGQLEEFCNRKFARVEDDTFEVSADREHVVLPRYPIEEVSALELREDLATGWVDQGEISVALRQIYAKSGLVEIGVALGTTEALLRFTYSGGYHWEQLEPDDDGFPTALPEGATTLPDNLLLAWKLQCEWVWNKRDKLGLSIGEKPDNVFSGSLSKVVLLDGVKELLRPFMRHSST